MKNTEYEPLVNEIGRTNVACRIRVCHVNHNIDKGAISLEEVLAGKPLPLKAPKKALEQSA